MLPAFSCPITHSSERASSSSSPVLVSTSSNCTTGLYSAWHSSSAAAPSSSSPSAAAAPPSDVDVTAEKPVPVKPAKPPALPVAVPLPNTSAGAAGCRRKTACQIKLHAKWIINQHIGNAHLLLLSLAVYCWLGHAAAVAIVQL
eukprot:GHRQ01034784.1.p1 GENE.GHRQ01034784.1~~GHRQ01034784.1.p1  ORF type:complete len:144 (+),score=3.82 GHRQ01034784.1:528-959(+)